MSRSPTQIDGAKNVAFHFLAYRARTCREMEKKLRARGFPDTVIQETLRYFKKSGYLDDRAFAADWVGTRARNRFIGPLRLLKELESRGIDEETREKAVDQLFQEVEERDLALAAAEKRRAMIRKDGSADGFKIRRRLYGYLKRKGFSPETVHSVINGLMSNTEQN